MEDYISHNDIKQSLSNLPQLLFEVTDACNLRCEYCGYGDFYGNHDSRKNSHMPIKKAIMLIDYLIGHWTSGINTSYSQETYISFYGGEPLLYMEFIRQVVEYVEQLKITSKQFAFSMTTNAMLIDKHIDYLVEKNFRLLISLDGNEKHHSYRVDHAGRNSFDKVFRNVQMMQKKYPSFFEKSVNFNAVLHNRNSVDETYRFIKNEFDKKPHIAELNGTGIREDKKGQFMQTYRNKYENLHQSEHYEEIQEDMFYEAPDTQSLGIFLHQYSGNVFLTYNDLLFDSPQKRMYPTGTCMPFSKKMFVTVNGKVLPCERIGQQYALGQVTDTGVILDFEKIAQKYNAWLNKLAQQCSHCHNTKACIQCIFNLDGLEQKAACKGFMNREAFERYKNTQMSYLTNYPHLYEKIMKEVIVC